MEKIKSKTKKIVAIALSAVLLAVGLATYFIFRDTEESNPEVEIPGMSVEDGLEQGINLSARLLSVEEYDEYGVSPLADSAISVTATVTSSDATYKTLVWSVAWKDASSTWASGKTVTDYVTVTPTSEGALTATVSCKQAFGEQVVLKAALKGFEDTIYGTKNVDYYQRVNSINIMLKQGDYVNYDYSVSARTYSAATTINLAFPLGESSFSAYKTVIGSKGKANNVLNKSVGSLSANITGNGNAPAVYMEKSSYDTYKALVEKFGGTLGKAFNAGSVFDRSSTISTDAVYLCDSFSVLSFVDMLGLGDCTDAFNWGGFKQAFSAQCSNIEFIFVTEVSENQTVCFYQKVKFNASTESFVTGIDLGSDSIVF